MQLRRATGRAAPWARPLASYCDNSSNSLTSSRWIPCCRRFANWRLPACARLWKPPQTSLVFLLENGKRLALRRNGQEYALNGRRFAAEELMARADSLSPNALLRPAVQDSMLPTAGYTGGPAE